MLRNSKPFTTNRHYDRDFYEPHSRSDAGTVVGALAKYQEVHGKVFFTKETAHGVIQEYLDVLERWGLVACEQYIGDILWSGRSAGKLSPAAPRLLLDIAHAWAIRAELQHYIAEDVAASAFDDVSNIVDKVRALFKDPSNSVRWQTTYSLALSAGTSQPQGQGSRGSYAKAISAACDVLDANDSPFRKAMDTFRKRGETVHHIETGPGSILGTQGSVDFSLARRSPHPDAGAIVINVSNARDEAITAVLQQGPDTHLARSPVPPHSSSFIEMSAGDMYAMCLQEGLTQVYIYNAAGKVIGRQNFVYKRDDHHSVSARVQ